jgi:hypothetical protein
MDKTYILRANDDVLDGKVCICSRELVTDNCSCCGNPRVVPVGLAEILKFVSWM